MQIFNSYRFHYYFNRYRLFTGEVFKFSKFLKTMELVVLKKKLYYYYYILNWLNISLLKTLPKGFSLHFKVWSYDLSLFYSEFIYLYLLCLHTVHQYVQNTCVVFLPKKITKYTVLKSPFVNKASKSQMLFSKFRSIFYFYFYEYLIFKVNYIEMLIGSWSSITLNFFYFKTITNIDNK